jgi:hypothetical protein
MFDLIFSPQAHERLGRACATIGVSPAAMKVLVHLEPGQGVPMSAGPTRRIGG